ncbi:hypothetical protein AAC387_Pa08g1837 [Persea americana]
MLSHAANNQIRVHPWPKTENKFYPTLPSATGLAYRSLIDREEFFARRRLRWKPELSVPETGAFGPRDRPCFAIGEEVAAKRCASVLIADASL